MGEGHLRHVKCTTYVGTEQQACTPTSLKRFDISKCYSMGRLRRPRRLPTELAGILPQQNLDFVGEKQTKTVSTGRQSLLTSRRARYRDRHIFLVHAAWAATLAVKGSASHSGRGTETALGSACSTSFSASSFPSDSSHSSPRPSSSPSSCSFTPSSADFKPSLSSTPSAVVDNRNNCFSQERPECDASTASPAKTKSDRHALVLCSQGVRRSSW